MKIKSIKQYFFDKFSRSKDGARTKMEACLGAYKRLFMDSQDGDLVLADLMREAGMDSTVQNKDMSYETLVQKQCYRNVINYILGACDISEIEFLEKLKGSK